MPHLDVAILQWTLCLLVLAFFLYWLKQLVAVLTTDVTAFEDHKHKLLWFLVVFLAPVIGAIWFAVWQSQNSARRLLKEEEANIAAIAQKYRRKESAD